MTLRLKISAVFVFMTVLGACSAPANGPDSQPSAKSAKLNFGDTIITTNVACDKAYQCILAKRPEYKATLETIDIFKGEARVEACNNSLINPLEIVPECTPDPLGS